ncbi:hypothetical protein CCP1ISM_60012 [Azospirillaceae bacterium]
MKSKEFEKGREYESLSHSALQHKFLGFGCLFFSILLFFVSFFRSQKDNYLTVIFLLGVGIISLYLGFSEAKELKEMRE